MDEVMIVIRKRREYDDDKQGNYHSSINVGIFFNIIVLELTKLL